MSFYQGKDARKTSGGIRRKHRGKRKFELGGPFTSTKLSNEELREKVRVRGGNYKIKLKKAAFANIVDPETKTARKVKILGVLESKANREYARSEIIVKGTIINTELGRAVVTSRPGQEGIVNAVLIKEAK
jgi:small subunit ribosomal protein S8e